MSDENEHILICGRGEQRIPGYVVKPCSDCGREVWIAPSGQRRLRIHPMRILCFDCGMASLGSDTNPTVQPLQPDQLQEIEDWLRRN